MGRRFTRVYRHQPKPKAPKKSELKKRQTTEANLEDALNDFTELTKLISKTKVDLTEDEKHVLTVQIGKLNTSLARMLRDHLDRQRFEANNEDEYNPGLDPNVWGNSNKNMGYLKREAVNE